MTGDETSPSGTDGATAGSADETVGPQPLDRGPCDRVEQCLYDTNGAITPFLAVYGEDGTCWEDFPTEACWQIESGFGRSSQVIVTLGLRHGPSSAG